MKGPFLFLLLIIIIGSVLLLAFWQFGIVKKERTAELSTSEKNAEELLNFLKNFDFASDFQKLREKLPAGVAREIIPLSSSTLGVTDPFGFGYYSTSSQ